MSIATINRLRMPRVGETREVGGGVAEPADVTVRNEE